MQIRMPMKFKQKLTIWQLANHEFVRALRVMRRNTADIEIWQLLINERRKVMNNFLIDKYFSVQLQSMIPTME